MTKRVFTSEQDNEVGELYLNGLSSIQIAKRYNVDKSSVLGALERAGVPRRIRKATPKGPDKRYTFKSSEESQIIKIYQAGYNMRDIARAYNCKSGTIRKLLDRHGIPTREVLTQAANKVRDRQIITLYQSGNTIAESASLVGFSESVTYKALVKNDINRRPIRKRFFNEHAFDNLDNEHALYWAGFLYADSSISKYELRVSLSIKDVGHLKKFTEFMQGNLEVKSNHKACSLSLYSEYIAKALIDLGIVSMRGHFNKTRIPAGLERHFIRGYIDGDGCISNREKVIILGQADILTWIKEIFVRDAGASDKVMPYQRKGILEIAWGGSFQFRRIVDYIYQDATIYLERKKEIADKAKRGRN